LPRNTPSGGNKSTVNSDFRENQPSKIPKKGQLGSNSNDIIIGWLR